jgi:hypothetical protein
MGLDGERPYEPQATFAIGEDAHDMGAAPDLLVQARRHSAAPFSLVNPIADSLRGTGDDRCLAEP